jgi:hypothetical protein
MGKSQYLVAKYVPDLFRNEPINIGVLAWIDGSVAFRFLGQKSDGSIDGRAKGLAGTVKSISNYKQWIDSWAKRASKAELSSRKFGTVQKSSPDFMRVLSTYSEGNYILEEGGEIIEEADSEKVGEITDYLFDRLVGATEEKPTYKSPEIVRDELLKEAEVTFDERVKINHRVPLELRGKQFNPEFNLYIGNGTPDLLGQMVPLTAHPKYVQNCARATELLFLRVIESNLLSQDKCIAFVYAQEDRSDIDLIQESIEELRSVATIVNITEDRRSAIQSIRTWVNSSRAH